MLTLHYAPKTRSLTALWLLEELGEPYTLHVVDMAANEHKSADFLKLNPMGKVPVVEHDDLAISETGALAIYLADRFPEAKLSPSLASPTRADFLRWVLFSGNVMEPSYGEKFFKWEVPAASVAWGCFDDMLNALTKGLEGKDYLLGNSFSSADVVVGNTLRFGQLFGVIPENKCLDAYSARLQARPAFKRALKIEEENIAAMSL